MKDSDFSLMTVVFYVLLFLGFCGWVANIITIAQADGFSGMLILRIIGVFMAPLGAVLGFF